MDALDQRVIEPEAEVALVEALALAASWAKARAQGSGSEARAQGGGSEKLREAATPSAPCSWRPER